MSSNRFASRTAGALIGLAMMALTPTVGLASASCSASRDSHIPTRQSRAPAGSEVMAKLQKVQGTKRDAEVVGQVLSGNVPSFLWQLQPVALTGQRANGETVEVTICVTPEYLAVGNDRDFVRVPMGLAAAARIATEMGFLLPTTKMVDEIYRQARVHLPPRPMKPTAQMESTTYLLEHNRTLDAQKSRDHQPATELTAGQKKDIVLTNRLRSKPGRVAIYGWHRLNGKPIQPLSTVHGAAYADYSHGVRLVSRTAFVNGKPEDLAMIMQDRDLARIVSSEGPIADPANLLARQY
ncbi:hypothetical protein [Pseudodonghicola flavimaris]|uniref:Lipoprotein n=1 Tax=Pseudodonghicola flavimaris TaxID=3050036 RepID=A0ABT7F1X9_9RHOB|nr:hypothetical protein [Pseudodonghicola flavimaris]MDK3018601.1 hypothetical protein [Pseudodonghicola flavimaris]